MTEDSGARTGSGIFTITVVAGVDVVGRLAPESQQDAICIEFTAPNGGTTLYAFPNFVAFLAALDFQTIQSRKSRQAALVGAGTLSFSIKGAADVIVKVAAEGATAAIVVDYEKRIRLHYEFTSLPAFFAAIDFARAYAPGRPR